MRASNSHGHPPGEESPRAVRSYDHRVELTAETELDLFVVERAQYVEKILGVETDRHGRTAVIHRDLIEPVSRVGRFRADSHRPLAHGQLDASGALAGCNRHSAQRVGKRGARD